MRTDTATTGAGGAPAIPGIDQIAIERDLAPLEAEWRLFETTAAGHVFQTFTVVSTWLATVGRSRGVAPLIVVGRDAKGATRFILPLALSRRFGLRQLEWLGAEHADYHAGLYDRAFLARQDGTGFAEAIIARLAGKADLVCFQRQPAAIDGLANPFAGYRPLRHADGSHETHLGESWDAYYRGKRNSSSRRHDRGKLKNLEAIGEVRCRDLSDPAEIARAMAFLFAEKEQSLTAMGAGGFFNSEAVKQFYAGLAASPFPAGPAHVAVVECGGETVAVNWGLVRGDRYYYVMHAFAGQSPAARFSPGRLLMHHLMQWCIARAIRTFDFTIGDEDFKDQWCEATLPLADSVAPLNVMGAPLAMALRSAKTAKRLIKASPALRGAAEEIRRRLPSGRAPAVPSETG